MTSPVEWSKEGDELVGTHAHSKEVVARIKLSGPLLVGEATVPSAVRLLLGNANKLTISNLKRETISVRSGGSHLDRIDPDLSRRAR